MMAMRDLLELLQLIGPGGSPRLAGGRCRTADCYGCAGEVPPHSILSTSWRCRSYGALSRTARFSPALALTFLPGLSRVPLADLVRPFARRSSMATQPWFLARWLVSLWVKSCRRRACRVRSLAIWLMVRPSRLE